MKPTETKTVDPKSETKRIEVVSSPANGEDTRTIQKLTETSGEALKELRSQVAARCARVQKLVEDVKKQIDTGSRKKEKESDNRGGPA